LGPGGRKAGQKGINRVQGRCFSLVPINRRTKAMRGPRWKGEVAKLPKGGGPYLLWGRMFQRSNSRKAYKRGRRESKADEMDDGRRK